MGHDRILHPTTDGRRSGSLIIKKTGEKRMKKITNGRIYDTETAEEIKTYFSNFAQTDFNHFEETLFRKRTSEFFLFGKGGPMSPYARRVGINEWTGGEAIIPLTEEEARR